MTRTHLILIALLSLLVGTLVYVTRPAGALFLVPLGDLSGVSSGALSFAARRLAPLTDTRFELHAPERRYFRRNPPRRARERGAMAQH